MPVPTAANMGDIYAAGQGGESFGDNLMRMAQMMMMGEQLRAERKRRKFEEQMQPYEMQLAKQRNAQLEQSMQQAAELHPLQKAQTEEQTLASKSAREAAALRASLERPELENRAALAKGLAPIIPSQVEAAGLRAKQELLAAQTATATGLGEKETKAAAEEASLRGETAAQALAQGIPSKNTEALAAEATARKLQAEEIAAAIDAGRTLGLPAEEATLRYLKTKREAETERARMAGTGIAGDIATERETAAAGAAIAKAQADTLATKSAQEKAIALETAAADILTGSMRVAENFKTDTTVYPDVQRYKEDLSRIITPKTDEERRTAHDLATKDVVAAMQNKPETRAVAERFGYLRPGQMEPTKPLTNYDIARITEEVLNDPTGVRYEEEQQRRKEEELRRQEAAAMRSIGPRGAGGSKRTSSRGR